MATPISWDRDKEITKAAAEVRPCTSFHEPEGAYQFHP